MRGRDRFRKLVRRALERRTAEPQRDPRDRLASVVIALIGAVCGAAVGAYECLYFEVGQRIVFGTHAQIIAGALVGAIIGSAIGWRHARRRP